MELKNVVPWGRNFKEYKDIFLLSEEDLELRILGCGDGPSSFNYEASKKNYNITSIDPIYQFTKEEIQNRIEQTSKVVTKEVSKNKDNYIWKNIKSVDDLIDTRLTAMNYFIEDYDLAKKDKRYIYDELPNLSFKDNSFDLVLSSHFLFLYSKHFNLDFHINSILEMLRVAKKEVRIFPLLNLKNEKSEYLEEVLEVLTEKGYKVDIVKTNYEFQKNANKMLKIEIS